MIPALKNHFEKHLFQELKIYEEKTLTLRVF